MMFFIDIYNEKKKWRGINVYRNISFSSMCDSNKQMYLSKV